MKSKWTKQIDYFKRLNTAEVSFLRAFEADFYGESSGSRDGYSRRNSQSRCLLNQNETIALEDIQVDSQLTPETIVMHQEVLEKYGRRRMKTG